MLPFSVKCRRKISSNRRRAECLDTEVTVEEEIMMKNEVSHVGGDGMVDSGIGEAGRSLVFESPRRMGSYEVGNQRSVNLKKKG